MLTVCDQLFQDYLHGFWVYERVKDLVFYLNKSSLVPHDSVSVS